MISIAQRIRLCQQVSMIAMLIFGLWLEHHYLLEPCIICTLQRWLLTVMLVLTCCRSLNRFRGSITNKILHMIVIMMAMGLSWHHITLQNNPNLATGCFPSLDVLVTYYQWQDIIKHLFSNISCAKLQWQLLGLSIPQWLLIACVYLGLLLVLEYKTSDSPH